MISFSVLTCIQQSVMNLGILMVQGLVNSFGTVVMAAFAAAVKIDAFAYMPVQDFGNAFSTFIAQNYGAKEKKRIQQGLKAAVCISAIFCVVISVFVRIFAKQLLLILNAFTYLITSQIVILAGKTAVNSSPFFHPHSSSFTPFYQIMKIHK